LVRTLPSRWLESHAVTATSSPAAGATRVMAFRKTSGNVTLFLLKAQLADHLCEALSVVHLVEELTEDLKPSG